MAFHTFGGGTKGIDSRGQENDGDLHIINQLRKIVDLEMEQKVRFLDGSHIIVDFREANSILKKYEALRTSIEKEEMTSVLWKSSEHFGTILN